MVADDYSPKLFLLGANFFSGDDTLILSQIKQTEQAEVG